jgi:hypothetical protein
LQVTYAAGLWLRIDEFFLIFRVFLLLSRAETVQKKLIYLN